MPRLASAISAWNAIGTSHYFIAGVITVGFTLIARWLRGVTNGGAVAGGIVCFLLYIGAGPPGFMALIVVFVLTWLTTRWGYHKKQTLGIAEERSGRRATQVLANVGIAALCAFLHALDPGQILYLLAAAAALSEAAADTVSSEMGQAGLDNRASSPPGSGFPPELTAGSRWPGFSGCMAAALVGLVCASSGLIPWKWVLFAGFGGIGGMLVDSLMGATLERRGWLNNDGVNLASTGVSIALALLVYFLANSLT